MNRLQKSSSSGFSSFAFRGVFLIFIYFVGCTRQVAAVTSSNVSFGLIPPEDWNQPDWIDEDKAKAGRDALVEQEIIYGGISLRRNASYTPLTFQ